MKEINKSFEERFGIKEEKGLQIKGVSYELKNRLWNYFYLLWHGRLSSSRQDLIKGLWINTFNSPLDQLPFNYHFSGPRYLENKAYGKINQWFFSSSRKWYETYKFFEEVFMLPRINKSEEDHRIINHILDSENSGYRLINGVFLSITNEEELDEISEAIHSKELGDESYKEHLNKAIRFLRATEDPDYANSIKESISAIELMIKSLCEDKNISFDKGMKKLGNRFDLNKNLTSGIIKQYHYTSDEGGVRHSLKGERSKVGFAEAKYMLIWSSSTINFLAQKEIEIRISERKKES